MVRKPKQIKGKEKIALPTEHRPSSKMPLWTSCSKTSARTTRTRMICWLSTFRASRTTSIRSQMILACHRNRKAQRHASSTRLKRKSEVPTWAKERGGFFKIGRALSNVGSRNRTSWRGWRFRWTRWAQKIGSSKKRLVIHQPAIGSAFIGLYLDGCSIFQIRDSTKF